MTKKIFSIFTITAFVFTSILPGPVFAQVTLPPVGQMVKLSTSSFEPTLIRGIQINPQNPFQLDFIVKGGDDHLTAQEFKEETTRMVKYFLASLTTPEKDLWVNLSPFEKNRIVPPQFGKTEMGRDLLAQDYILKQLTSSLVYPEDASGKAFWSKIYKSVAQQTGSANIPMNAFNKVWVVPKDVLIYENERGALIAKASLQVMLEEDLLAAGRLSKDQASVGEIAPAAKEALRSVIIPLIEKEVNQGKHFATLRQAYYSLALATWYKKRLKESILGHIYMNQKKVAGVTITDKQDKEQIYQQYLKAFKKGVFNYIKEDPVETTPASPAGGGQSSLQGQTIPRKYFAGGKDFSMISDVTRLTRDASLAPKDLSTSTSKVVRFLLNTIAAAGILGGAHNASGQIAATNIFSQDPKASLIKIHTGTNDLFFKLHNDNSPGDVVNSNGVVVGSFGFTSINDRLSLVRVSSNDGTDITASIETTNNPLQYINVKYTVVTDAELIQRIGWEDIRLLVLQAPFSVEQATATLKSLGHNPSATTAFAQLDGKALRVARQVQDLKKFPPTFVENNKINFLSAQDAAASQWARNWGADIILSTFVETPVTPVNGVKAFYEASVIKTGGAGTVPDGFKSIGFVMNDGRRVHLFFAAPTDSLDTIAYLRDILTRALIGDFVALSDLGNNRRWYAPASPQSPQMIISALTTILDDLYLNPQLLKSIPEEHIPERVLTSLLNTYNPQNGQHIVDANTAMNLIAPYFLNYSDRLAPGTITWYSDANFYLQLVPDPEREAALPSLFEMSLKVSEELNTFPLTPEYADDAGFGIGMLSFWSTRITDGKTFHKIIDEILAVSDKWVRSNQLIGHKYALLQIKQALMAPIFNSDPKAIELIRLIDDQLTKPRAQASILPKMEINNSDVGGINFDPAQINMQLKFDGEGFRMDPAVLARFKDLKIDGLSPVMIGISPFDDKAFLFQPMVK